jgi:alpha-tubulin suppressor-like RCC1 family protein
LIRGACGWSRRAYDLEYVVLWMARRSTLRAVSLAALLGCGGATGASPTSRAASVVGGDSASESRQPQKVVAVATGDFHTCVIVAGGNVMCFGRNRDGELGDGGNAGNRARPIAVPNVRDVQQVAAGHGFSCALAKDTTVRCWGSGRILGDDRPAEKVRATEVTGVSGVVELKAGGLVACARTKPGAVRCWGTDAIKKGAPTAGAEEIAVAGAHACARSLDGQITCWGEGLAKNTKQTARELAKASGLATGDSFVCVLVDGTVRCWGRNDQGELGMRADTETRTKPIVLKNLSGAVKISAAEARACVVTKDGGVFCWGSNNEGELGRNTRSPTELPGLVEGVNGATDVAVGAGHVCALSRDGTLACWGGNRQGQLGDGTLESRAIPKPITW